LQSAYFAESSQFFAKDAGLAFSPFQLQSHITSGILHFQVRLLKNLYFYKLKPKQLPKHLSLHLNFTLFFAALFSIFKI